ncbi:MAG: hypothetical protein JSS56_14335 [Proteobacteria bacterium]|nr:hypothetical protein [Pseudomonadota bacterium]
MKKAITSSILALAMGCSAMLAPVASHAQSDASLAVSALPVASVVLSAAAAGAAASTVVAVPAALSVAGSQLVIKSVQASADAVVYVLERVADGAQASVRVSLGAGSYSIKQVDTAVSVVVIATGVMLVATGELLAFIPNEAGRALLHSAKLSS